MPRGTEGKGIVYHRSETNGTRTIVMEVAMGVGGGGGRKTGKGHTIAIPQQRAEGPWKNDWTGGGIKRLY